MKSRFIACNDSKLNDRSGQIVEVMHELMEGECDRADVGPMFHVKFADGYETDAFIDELPELIQYRLCEAIFDITQCFAVYVSQHPDSRKLSEADSRDIYAAIYGWAREFEAKNVWEGEYLYEIDQFAFAKLQEYFDEED